MIDLLGMGLFALLVVLLVSILTFILWIWAFFSIIFNRKIGFLGKIVWLIVIIALPFIGCLLYLLLGRKG